MSLRQMEWDSKFLHIQVTFKNDIDRLSHGTHLVEQVITYLEGLLHLKEYDAILYEEATQLFRDYNEGLLNLEEKHLKAATEKIPESQNPFRFFRRSRFFE